MGNTCNHGSVGGSENDDLFPGPNKLLWEVPCILDAETKADNAIGGPIANRRFSKGEVVELCHCLLMEPGDMSGTFLHPYLFPVDLRVGNASAGSHLWPYGWGLLYRQSSGLANMAVEHSFEAPQPPPVDEEAGSASETELEPCHWIRFRATRAISEGEELLVPPRVGQPRIEGIHISLYDACIDAWQEGSGILKKDNSLDDEYEASDVLAPESLELIERTEDLRIVAASPLHGIGIFAARDIEEGEVIEVDPMLPLPPDEIAESVLNHYVFETSIKSCATFDLMPIGMGASYNHSDKANIEHLCFTDTPYLRMWVATEFVPKGRELCFDYGKEYFQTREIEQKFTKYELVD